MTCRDDDTARPSLAHRLRMVALATPDGNTMSIRGLDPDTARFLADRLEAPTIEELTDALVDAGRSQIRAIADRKVRTERFGWFALGWFSCAATFWFCLTAVELLRGLR